MKGYLIIVSVVTIVIPSIQHYIPPPDMCMLAKSCNHTWVPECGIDGNSSTRRIFLDNCDMYEYNCDNNKDYTKIDAKECPQNCTTSGNLNNDANEYTIQTPIGITVTNSVASTETTPMNVETQTTSTTSHASETTASTTPSMTTDSTTILLAISETTISSIPNISKVEPVTETAPIITTSSTTLNKTVSTTTSSNKISTESTSNRSCTASMYTENLEELTDHDCSRKTTPEISSTSDISSTIEISSTTETMESTTEVIQTTETAAETTLTESFMTPQIIETTTTATTHIHSSPLTETIISTDNATELLQTTIAEKSETTTEFTSTQTNVTSITTNQTNVEDTSQNNSLPLNVTCNHYPKDCDRPVTWETAAEGETRDFYQILKQRFGNRVRLLRDTTHWPRKSAMNISDKMKSFFFGNHNEIGIY